MKKAITLLMFLFVMPAYCKTVTIEADDCNVGQSMHNIFPDIRLWRADNRDDVNYALAHCYDSIYAVESSHPDKPLGDNVIGDLYPPSGKLGDYWYHHEPHLFLEIHGLAKMVSVRAVALPGILSKTIVMKLYDANGNTVCYNYTKGTTLISDMGEYKAICGFIWPGSVRSIDHLVIDYQPIPPPDFATFIDWWLCECSIPNLWCEGSDINHDMTVNFMDYARLCSEEWFVFP